MGARSRNGKSKRAAAAAKAAKAAEANPSLSKRNVTKELTQSLWQKVRDTDVELTPDEALRAAHWMRQGLGIFFGFAYGVVPFLGAPAIMTYLLLAAMIPPAILSIWNELDIEEIAKTSPLQTEGLMPSTALFFLTWIVSYTVFLPPRS